jgi:hypothetical protein
VTDRLFAYPAGGLVIELEATRNIVIRSPRHTTEDVVLVVTNIEELITGLRLCREYRDASAAES